MHITSRLRLTVLAAVFVACAACAPIPVADPTSTPAAVTPPAATATGTTASPGETPTGTVTAAVTETQVPGPTPTIEIAATAAPTETRTAAASPAPTAAASPVAAQTDNVFAVALGKVSAPAGWTVAPCEGNGPFLCVLKGQEHVGALQMSIYPIETMPDFQEMLAAAGVEAGPLDITDGVVRAGLVEALDSFAEAHHEAIRADREVEYGSAIRYEQVETEEVAMGALPGVRYAFLGINQDGSVFERWVSYAAYDGDLLYILVASYRPGAIPTFESDADLTAFLPHLEEIVAGLRLPLPALETAVTSVRALRNLDIFRSYSAEAGNPVGQVAVGESVTVTGVNPSGRHWRVTCPEEGQLNCWIAGTTDDTEPPAR